MYVKQRALSFAVCCCYCSYSNTFFPIVILCSVFCSCVRRFPQPEFFACLNLFTITSQITHRTSFGYSVANTIYCHSTVLGTVQTYFELVGIFSQSYCSYNAMGKMQILWKEITHSQAIFFIPPPSSTVLHLLQPFTPD